MFTLFFGAWWFEDERKNIAGAADFFSSAAYRCHKCEKMLPQVPQSGAYMSLIYALHSLIGGCSSENIEIVCVFARLALFLQSI